MSGDWPEDALLTPYRAHLESMAARYPGLAATDPPGEMAVISILRTGSMLMSAVSHNLAPFGVSESAFNMLTLLAARPEGMTQTELSRCLIVSRANVTGLVDRLAARNLVERQKPTRDRRVCLVTITPGGRDILDRVVPVHYRFLDGLLAGLTGRDKRELIRILARVRRLLPETPGNT
ncbi:MAG: MarR family transcriptional regulator [Peptococcaceae bacterium]|nr:MarR family transcriptional regulator [Peptococcaceae bacterium]